MNPSSHIPEITVSICTLPEVRFVLHQDFRLDHSGENLRGGFVARSSGNIIVVEQDGIMLGTGPELLLKPASADSSFTIADVTIGVQFHWQRKEDQRFVGGLKLVRSDEGITVINCVNIEDYLTSVISSEMSADSSMDLLKAHAVTSRSWLLAQLEKSRGLKANPETYTTLFETGTERIRWYDREDHALFDVCADDHCQRYQGVTKAYTESVSKAVRETAGRVVTFEGRVCDARFSKSCGGVTELFENVWEPVAHPYLAVVADTPDGRTPYAIDFADEAHASKWIREAPSAFCNTSDPGTLAQVLPKFDQETTDFFRWKVEYAQEELAALIAERSGLDFGKISDLVPVERGTSARLIRLRIVGTKRSLVIGKELEIRRTLSPSHLYSSAFVVDKYDIIDGVPQRFVLTGAGWGHGVGLCQIGAAVMGEQGYSYEKILSHYFPRAVITQLY